MTMARKRSLSQVRYLTVFTQLFPILIIRTNEIVINLYLCLNRPPSRVKSFVAISFLILLLYHLIGLPLAVLTFEQSYESATPVSRADQWKMVKLPISLPYTSTWENSDGQDGLIQDGTVFYNIVRQHYANDTLYTLLKTNQSARERFFELADQFQQLDNDQEETHSPLGRLLKLLKDRLTTYLPPLVLQLAQPDQLLILRCVPYGSLPLSVCDINLDFPSPPPRS